MSWCVSSSSRWCIYGCSHNQVSSSRSRTAAGSRESCDFQPVSRLPHQTWSRSEIHSFSGKWWLMDSTCRSLGRSLPQPPALWGTRWAGRGGCNEGSSYFWDPRWRRWSLLPPETKTRTHTHEWVDRAGVEEIRSRTYCELNLAAPHDVIQEGVHFDDLQLEMQRREIGSGKKERAAADRHTSDSFELCRRVHLLPCCTF